ncbi:hypothetical protein [Catellatospora citrea]|uniref:Matrixin n=1 Tax=Catellatospora citrea TaxID=53366 RepID=A0A8J3KKT5_9ACTN|nr:hypothetical protein [Catellatospora citrea]GIF97729.1 hypothetical protein Cci01nite_28230 [Catellatospora citrea]
MALPAFSVKPYDYNSLWQVPMDRALSAWNVTPTPVWITKSSSAKSIIVAQQYPGKTWFGLYTPHGSKPDRYFDIKLNSLEISKATTNFDKFVQYNLVHELGHALSLIDNPVTSQVSIMKYGVDFNLYYVPQQYDINDVNNYYN